jgi:acyl-CoA thioesterase I
VRAPHPVTRRRPRGRAALAALVVAATALLAGACGQGDAGSGGGSEGSTTAGQAGRADPSGGSGRVLYVAVGASESVGSGADDPLSQAWPQVLFRTVLPRETVFVNLGVPGSTVAEAMTQQVPDAVRLAPALATVWLNVNDLLSGVSPGDYERRLAGLVHQLRRGGATKVLLANTPPLDQLPAYRACLPGGRETRACRLPDRGELPQPAQLNSLIAAYNGAIARVAAREGATLVDLHTAGLTARAAGGEAALIGADGFHPSTAGHQAVAGAFAAALRAAGGI